MDDENVIYPTREVIELWIDFIKTHPTFSKFLPVIDDQWLGEIMGTIERVKVSYIYGVGNKAAHLFYYIIKDHRFPDGNKRSGIVIAYLFFLINGCQIQSAERIRFLAKKVAKSHGSAHKDNWMRKIQKEFSYVCKPTKTK